MAGAHASAKPSATSASANGTATRRLRSLPKRSGAGACGDARGRLRRRAGRSAHRRRRPSRRTRARRARGRGAETGRSPRHAKGTGNSTKTDFAQSRGRASRMRSLNHAGGMVRRPVARASRPAAVQGSPQPARARWARHYRIALASAHAEKEFPCPTPRWRSTGTQRRPRLGRATGEARRADRSVRGAGARARRDPRRRAQYSTSAAAVVARRWSWRTRSGEAAPVTAVDISRPMLERAEQRARDAGTRANASRSGSRTRRPPIRRGILRSRLLAFRRDVLRRSGRGIRRICGARCGPADVSPSSAGSRATGIRG